MTDATDTRPGAPLVRVIEAQSKAKAAQLHAAAAGIELKRTIVEARDAGFTLEQIAKEMKISRERVRQLCERPMIG